MGITGDTADVTGQIIRCSTTEKGWRYRREEKAVGERITESSKRYQQHNEM